MKIGCQAKQTLELNWKEKVKCQKCKILFELYDQVEKTNRNYWLMTELFVMIHNGKDECGGEFRLKGANMVKDLEEKIKFIRENYIDELLTVLKKCPDADEITKEYPELRSYLIELSEKYGGLLDNLICALEYYLEK